MQRAQDRAKGTAYKGPFAVEVSAKLVSKQWDHSVQRQRQVRQGALVAALAEDPESFPM